MTNRIPIGLFGYTEFAAKQAPHVVHPLTAFVGGPFHGHVASGHRALDEFRVPVFVELAYSWDEPPLSDDPDIRCALYVRRRGIVGEPQVFDFKRIEGGDDDGE